MKKLIYISGIVSANLMMFGSLFKIFHWPYGGLLITLATLIFGFFFLPSALISYYRSSTGKYKTLCVVTFLVFFCGVVSILLKIQHWPYSRELFLISLPLPFVLFLPVYFYETRNENKVNGNYLAVMLGLTFLAVFSVLLSVH